MVIQLLKHLENTKHNSSILIHYVENFDDSDMQRDDFYDSVDMYL